MYPASSEGLNKETEDSVYFFTVPFGSLNNFSSHQIHIWDRDFSTAEYAYQWKKFFVTEPELAEKILSVKSSHLVKEVALANQDKIPQNWREERVGVMEEILRTKAKQHEDVRDALKRTNKRKIIENSPFDNFWGVGPDGNGQNMVGKLWMKVRDELF